MTAARIPMIAFSSGEISPLLHARKDYQRYQTGARAMRGFLPLREGGFTRAPGTIFRGYTKNNAPGRLIGFEFAKNDAVVLELTAALARFWRYGALVDSGGAPYELVMPYAEADLPGLQWEQSADVIYMADGTQPVQKISRFALDNWTIGGVVFKQGPFRVQNLDEAITIQASASSGSITLTGTGSPFAITHIGVLFRLQPVDYTLIPLWTSNTAIAVGQLMRYGQNVYELTSGTDTGPTPPTHKKGDQLYQLGAGGARWKFLSDDVGIVKITAFTNANSVTATVIKQLPQGVVDDPTYRWAEGAWSSVWGYPKALEIFDQSLFAGHTETEPRTVWASTLGDFEDYEPSVEADGSFAYAIGGGDSQNAINWLHRGKKGLYLGATGEIYRGFSVIPGQRSGPATFDSDLEATSGTADVRPISPYGFPVYVTGDGMRLEELRYTYETESGEPLELTAPASHIGLEGGGFVELAWQKSPLRLIWSRRAAGDLAVTLYDPNEDVLGWAVVPLAGGEVESLCVTSSPSGGRDIVTMIVKRQIDGATVRMIEELADVYGVLTGAEPISEAVHLYAALEFTPDPATDTFTVAHLVGEDVYAWTDEGQFGPFTVPAGGQIVLPVNVGRAVIGKFDATHHAETLDIEAQAPDGDARGRPERLKSGGGIVLHRSAAGYVQGVERDFAQPVRTGAPVDLVPRAVASALVDGFSGTTDLPVQTGYAQETSLRFTPFGGAPLTVLGVIPPIEEAGP